MTNDPLIQTDRWIALRQGNAASQDSANGSLGWSPFQRGLTVNIVCSSDTSVHDLEHAVEHGRGTRVGFDAHFPPLVVWVRPAPTTSDYCEALNRLDRSTPRVCLMIISDGTEDIEGSVQVCRRCREVHLSCQILCILHRRNMDSLSILISRLERHALLDIARFEWFFSSGESEEWALCATVMEELQSAQYAFARQPLNVCGGIAAFVRARVLSDFGVAGERDAVATDAEHQANPAERLQCAFDAIQYVMFARERPWPMLCTCRTAGPPQKLLDEVCARLAPRMAQVADEILFEDWQYIYDGFQIT